MFFNVRDAEDTPWRERVKKDNPHSFDFVEAVGMYECVSDIVLLVNVAEVEEE